MRLVRNSLPLLTVAATLWLGLPRTFSWVDLGFTLSSDQRDFRVYNNFTDPEANDNTSEHQSFPGATGATLAIWKGCVEWGSRLHGDGEGDPAQPAGLGSGGANFDPSFQGLATGAGDIGDNTFSELPGCAGGTHAFTQFFLDGTGWRTFFYECWAWEDGPEEDWQPKTGHLDIQGIATHEYGHALGLGHSSDPDATMFATTQDGKALRTLESDDIAGVQALYGIAAATKPRIDSLSIDNGTLTIHGANFIPTGNEVWFTQAAAGGDGTPITTFGDSPSGTEIVVTVPAGAGPGDVLVRIGPGDGTRLSNAFPFDARLDCNPITSVCATTPNSVGAGAVMVVTGGQSVSADTTVLNAVGSPPNQWGLFFHGTSSAQIPLGNGTLCIGGSLVRLPAVQADGAGRSSWPLDLAGMGVQAGETLLFQWWYRDTAAGGAGYDFSDAVAVPFCQ